MSLRRAVVDVLPHADSSAHVARLAQQLDPGEAAMLTDAIEHERDINIHYRNTTELAVT